MRHNDLDQLEAKLGRLAQDGRAALVVWDSVFSMEGDVVDLPRLLEISRAAGARTLVDEAHSLGLSVRTAAAWPSASTPAPTSSWARSASRSRRVAA